MENFTGKSVRFRYQNNEFHKLEYPTMLKKHGKRCKYYF